MPKCVFLMSQNTPPSDIYIYYVQFAETPMSRAVGDVYRITHLSPRHYLCKQQLPQSHSFFFGAVFYIVIRTELMWLGG
jgi:hypothetical protein